ncbi:WbuC family cupin fold metalloprotein [Candidatus Marinimicrobia bacterium]|nr:WbuC family cupin fold metalloprotein [Candidatus Neomarinimicrobiota bacterium]
MKLIYSKITPSKLLHLIHSLKDIESLSTNKGLARINVAPIEELLQLATLKMDKGKTFEPHKHIYKEGEKKVIAQESWIVIKGKVKVIMYDLDDTIIDEVILTAGDCSMTFAAGHNYIIQEDNTIVYEYKTGPYKGIKNDKVLLNEI